MIAAVMPSKSEITSARGYLRFLWALVTIGAVLICIAGDWAFGLAMLVIAAVLVVFFERHLRRKINEEAG